MRVCVSCSSLGQGWLGLPKPVPSDSASDALPPPKIKSKRPQWSRGAGPGEYGGPPLDTRPRVWKKALHPLENKDEFIWNINWRPYFDEKPAPVADEEKEESTSGFLSFNRVMELDRLDQDLTEQLLRPVESSSVTETAPAETSQKTGHRWRYAPTRGERKKWERNRKAMVSLQDEDEKEDTLTSVRDSAKARERRRYKQLKANLQLLTLGIGGVGTTFAFALYSPTIGLSYVIGLAGSLVYVRMLGNSVDRFSGSGVKAAVRGVAGQPRLLVPVVLTMFFNRWNELLAPEYGWTQLQLIPILIGFFTYKIATIVQVVQDEASSLTKAQKNTN